MDDRTERNLEEIQHKDRDGPPLVCIVQMRRLVQVNRVYSQRDTGYNDGKS